MSKFEDHFIPEPNSGCWLWLDSLNNGGYGHYCINNRVIGAHRYSYELYKEPIGKFQVLHKCDQPCCVNPDHLFLGTHTDNMKDRNLKNRQAKGEKQFAAKLTLADIVKIRTIKDKTQAEIASMFGVSQANISNIIRHKAWA